MVTAAVISATENMTKIVRPGEAGVARCGDAGAPARRGGSGILVGVPAVDFRAAPRRAAAPARWVRSGALGLAVALSALSAPASAQTLTPEVTVSDFAPVTLTGAPTPTTATMSDFSVTDTEGRAGTSRWPPPSSASTTPGLAST